MPPATTLGSQTSHGPPLGPGPASPNVLIGGKPAWRALEDFHACPLIDPIAVPHVGGIVSAGSETVFINNMPAARQGDIIIESSLPNNIAIGEPTVIIG